MVIGNEYRVATLVGFLSANPVKEGSEFGVQIFYINGANVVIPTRTKRDAKALITEITEILYDAYHA